MDRAQHWGWPNTYTYTKSLGEQVIAGTPDLRYAIVRPSHRGERAPLPLPRVERGLHHLGAAGLRRSSRVTRSSPPPSGPSWTSSRWTWWPASLIGITAHGRSPTPSGASTSMASGDSNPFYAPRSVELVGLYRRRYYRERETGNALINDVQSRLEPLPVIAAQVPLPLRPALRRRRAPAAPGHRGPRAAPGARPGSRPCSSGHGSSWSGWRSRPARSRRSSTCSSPSSGRTATSSAATTPGRSTRGWIRPTRRRSPGTPDGIDWRGYFLEVHLPGLEKWVFPGLEEETREAQGIHAHRDLIELFDAAVHAYRHRVAFRRVEGEREERFTYGEVHRYAARVGELPPPDRGEARRPGAARLREPPRVAHRLLRHPPRGRHRGSGGSGLSEAEVVNIARRSRGPGGAALRGGGAGPGRPVAHAVRGQSLDVSWRPWPRRWRATPRSPTRIGTVRKSAVAGRRGLAHLHLRAPPARPRA